MNRVNELDVHLLDAVRRGGVDDDGVVRETFPAFRRLGLTKLQCWTPISLAVLKARITFSEFPLVERPTSISPLRAMPPSSREKISLKP